VQRFRVGLVTEPAPLLLRLCEQAQGHFARRALDGLLE
jgi:hypothetical protein